MDSLFDTISSINEPSFEGLKKELLKRIRPVSVPKGQILHQKNDIAKKGYFIKKGLLKSYVLDHKGKEHIFMFGPEGWFIGDIESEVFSTPSRLFIEAIEDSEIEAIDSDIVDLIPHFPAPIIHEEFNRLMKRTAMLQKRVLLLLGAPALERYQDFLKTYPDIHNRVPLKLIASYIGITPEALSVVRKELASNS